MLEAIATRQKLEEKLEDSLQLIDTCDEEDIVEWLGFCAMDFHLDVRSRLWALQCNEPEIRLAATVGSLQKMQEKVRGYIKAVEAGVNIGNPEPANRNSAALSSVTQVPTSWISQ